jgi:hypothetical protein
LTTDREQEKAFLKRAVVLHQCLGHNYLIDLEVFILGVTKFGFCEFLQ